MYFCLEIFNIYFPPNNNDHRNLPTLSTWFESLMNEGGWPSALKVFSLYDKHQLREPTHMEAPEGCYGPSVKKNPQFFMQQWLT